MSQHASLSIERWRTFTLDQQILMIANEMHRTGARLGSGDELPRRSGYERALALTDLTIRAHERRGLRRELLRWRDLVAALYVAGEGRPREHGEAFRALLGFTPTSFRQIAALGL